MEKNQFKILPKFPNDLHLDQDVINRLNSYLHLVVKGNDQILITPIGVDHNPKFILGEWDKIFKKNKHKINSTLYDLEMSNRSKYGPRSIAKPWTQRIDDVLDYFEPKTSSLSKSIIHTESSLRPLSYDNAIKILKNDTNSGLPYFVRKSRIKSNLINDTINSKINYPCILFTRTQENNKTRTVWGFPASTTLKEMRYYRPLLNYQSNLNWRSALQGPDSVDLAISKLFTNKTEEDIFVSIDFSKFDASISEKLIRCAFDYIQAKFQKSYHNEILEIRDNFLNIGLLTPSGIYTGSHGVPSGSTFTNEVDSLVQYIVAKSNVNIQENSFQIQGDDGVYLINKSILTALIDGFERAGLNVNKDKSYTSPNYCVYLQRLYHEDYKDANNFIGGIYPIYRALNRLIYQERFTNLEDKGLSGKDYFSIRSLSILENCKHHPLFKEFVLFIKELDKYSLEFSNKSIIKYEELVNNSPGVGGILYNQYGDKIKGIKSFKSYQIIKG